jgi:hypothetical protein
MSRPPHRTLRTVRAVPKGLTLTPEERHQAGYDRAAPTPGHPIRVGRLIKCHRFPVSFPDGTEGSCTYERLGPACHRFDYDYADGAALPRQYLTRPFTNVPTEIEKRGQELALDCFLEAIEVERRDYFKRITPPTSGARVPRPERFQMTAKRAKEHAGRYAVCTPVGRKLVPVSTLYDSLPTANHAWKALGMRAWVVACCNRMDRCWEQVKYNPLHAEGHPRPARNEREADRAH